MPLAVENIFWLKRSTISHEVIEVATFEEIDSENAS